MPIKGRKINIFESKKWVFGFLGTLFFSHAFFSAQLGSLKGWSGDEWYSYNDFTLMALPFSILTKFQISIIGPLTNVNFIYFKMQGLIWIALIFCLFYNQYFNSFNQSNKKYILFSTLFIGINPFILGQTQFFRYYNLYLLGAFISYYLIKQKGENFNINRKIFYSALIISPLMTGCETEEPEHSRNAAEGHAVAYGTWYKPEAGTTSSGWKWHWGYLYLEQNGTNVWGIYRWELYNPRDIKGFVNGNEIHLDLESHNEPNSLDGTING